MKKIISILILIALLWLLKLSFDFYKLSQQMSVQQQNLSLSDQHNATLNDQLVALQRKEKELAPIAIAHDKEKNYSNKITPTRVIQQQLELIQFALQQQQFVYALEKLNQLNLDLDDYEIADSLKQSIHQTILQDQQSIQQYVIAQHSQQARLAQMLQQLDQQIKNDLIGHKLSAVNNDKAYFWQKWLNIDVVGATTVNLNSRTMILKEVQLRIMLAQQALLISEYQTYQNMLQNITEQLDTLPDAASLNMKQQLVKIKQLHVLPVPKLKTREILG